MTIFKTKNDTTKFKIRTSRVSPWSHGKGANNLSNHHCRRIIACSRCIGPVPSTFCFLSLLVVCSCLAQYLYTLTLPNKKAEMILKIVPPGLREIKGKGVKKSA